MEIAGVKEMSDLIDSFVYDKEKMDLLLSGVAKNVWQERLKRNLSIHALGRLTGVNHSHIYKIEKGQTFIGLQTLLKIAYVMNVSLDELIPLKKTTGDIFNEITRDLDVESIVSLLDMTRKYSEYKRIQKELL